MKDPNAVQHIDEWVQQYLWDAQSNRLTLRSSMLGLCSNTLTQRDVAFITNTQAYILAALGVHSSCRGPAFSLQRAYIFAALGLHSSCTVCIAAALGPRSLNSSCAGQYHCTRPAFQLPRLAFKLHWTCILAALSAHSNCGWPAL